MKNTKRSLITSLVTLLLCSCMFIGSTFAWFTDTVSNTGNKIQAGTLDVELWQKTSTLSAAQQADTDHVKAITEEGYTDYSDISTSTVAVFNYNKWEPGYSTPAGFVIKNAGNLALKYELTFFVTDSKTGLENTESDAYDLEHLTKCNANSKLENVIEVYQGETKLGTLKDFFDGKVSYNGHLSAGETFSTSDLKLLMPTTAGNEYENACISFDIRLLATQYTEEYDGFGSNQYDALADEKPDHADWQRYNTLASDTETIKEGEDTVFKTGNNIAESSTGYTEVTVPSNVKIFADNTGSDSTIEVETTPILAANNLFTVSSDQGAVGAIDLTVKVDGEEVAEFKDSSDQPVEVTVKTFIAKGLTLNSESNKVGVEYKGEGTQPTFVSYDSSTGELVFKTKHFSQFLINADQVVYLENNNTAYLNPSDAFSYVSNGGTITMIKDYKYQSSPTYLYSQKAKYTLDLNGYTLDMNNSSYGLYALKDQTVTINDSRGDGELKNKKEVVLVADGANLIVNGGHLYGVDSDGATIYAYGNLTINGGVVDTAKKSGYDYYAVMLGNYSNNNTPAKFVMTNGEINGSLYVNGQDTDNNIINISGGSINGNSYIAGKTTTTITDGTFKGTTCFYFKTGIINISGGNFVSTKGDGDWKHYDSGSYSTGDAVIFEACNYPAGSLTMNITGGTFKGYKEEGGTEESSGNIYFKNYGVLAIDYAGDTVNVAGTTIPYRQAVVASNTDEKFLTTNGYLHFTDDNTIFVNPTE